MNIRKRWLITFFVLLLSAGPATLNAQELVKSEVREWSHGKQYYIHTVEQGQTLYAISRAYDVPVDELEYENPDARGGIAVGQVIKIPVISREKVIAEELRQDDFRYIFHIVRKGETLFGIARIYDIDPDRLKDANPEWEKGLNVGQYLKIPMKKPAGSQGAEITPADIAEIHTVVAGETLFSISHRYEVSLDALRAANPGMSGTLAIGQKVNIPAIEAEIEPEPVKPAYTEHIVAQKETLYGIARKYRISIDSLKAFNPGLGNDIFPGEVIRIPPGVNPDEYITHEVTEKTKLKELAENYDLSVTSLRDANPEAGARVTPGEVIMIPVGPPPPGTAIQTEAPVTTTPEKESGKPGSIDSLRCFDRNRPADKEFRIALMIPLYTESVRDIDLSRMEGDLDPDAIRPFSFVQFYEGFMLAMEDLKKQGLKARLYVYDVDDKVSKTIEVLQEPGLSDMDLIVGPFFSRNFKLVANFAEMFGIPIVNPLTRRTEVLNNPYVFKAKPSRESQAQLLARFVRAYYSDANIIIVRRNSFQYQHEAKTIRAALDPVLPYGVNVSNQDIHDIIEEYSEADTTLPDGRLYTKLNVENRLIRTEELERSLRDSTFFTNTINEVIYSGDSIEGIIRSASVARRNLIIALTENEVFAPELLTRLNDLKDTFNITVVGMPEWEMFTNLETDYLLSLNVHFFTDSYFDYNDPRVMGFVSAFRQRYMTQPEQFAFEGYDLADFFLGAMMKFGSDCSDCLPYYRKELLKTSMQFMPAFPAGYENLYWNFCRYKDYRIIKFTDF